MTTPTLTAVLALVGTGLAYLAGALGGMFGGLLLIGATIFIALSGLVIGAEAYDKGLKDGQDDDIYD